jgi:hypothetical protein
MIDPFFILWQDVPDVRQNVKNADYKVLEARTAYIS